MNDLEQQRFKRRVCLAINEIDVMKAQLADVRICCMQVACAMRQFREQSELAQAAARQRCHRQRLRQQLKVVN